jgi:hypothetical protein
MVRDGCAAGGFGSFGRGAGYRASAGIGRRRVQHHREAGEPGPDIPNVAERQRRGELCDRVECRARLLSMPRARWRRQGLLPQQRARVPVLGEADRHLDPVRCQGDLYERPPARVPHVRSGHLTGESSTVSTAVGDQSDRALQLSPASGRGEDRTRHASLGPGRLASRADGRVSRTACRVARRRFLHPRAPARGTLRRPGVRAWRGSRPSPPRSRR